MYLTHDEYIDMGGTLEETAFNDFERNAESMINWYTFNRLATDTTYSYNVKACTYKLIELAYIKAQSLSVGQDVNGVVTSGAISSQSNDGFSTSYTTMSASEAFNKIQDEVKNVTNMYLAYETNSLGQKLLYRGMYHNE